MSLPGKLTIGYVDEDNPVKSYFRFRPLLTQEDEGFSPVDETTIAMYPEDGFIRIVPDKNEISQFKNRMRSLGRYCVLDLRRHPNENDKIRPNKNFMPDGTERNAHIVYSDVIFEVSPDLAVEVADLNGVFESEVITLRAPLPGTKYVALRHESHLSGPWVWQETEENPGCIVLRAVDGRAQNKIPIGDAVLCAVECGENRTTLLLNPQSLGFTAELDGEKREPAPELPAQAKPEERPAFSAAVPAVEPIPAPKPVPRRFLRDMTEGQIGINPRRGRSLIEVVDEQWRRSRCDQLGHPVPPEAMTTPIDSPVDRAIDALRSAWALPSARGSLLDALVGDELVSGALRGLFETPVKHADDETAQRLEAERLKLLSEIDALRIKRQDMRQALMQELRDGRRDEFNRYEQQNEALRREVEKNESAAEAARKAAEAADKLLGEKSDRLEQMLLDNMSSSHARELILRMNDAHRRPIGHPTVYDPSAGELISDLRVQMEEAGYTLSNDEAVNLMAAMVTGGTVILSGAPGTGKSGMARALAASLGLTGGASRFVQTRCAEDARIDELLEHADDMTLSVVVIDDVNDCDGDVPCADIIGLQEKIYAQNARVVLMLTAQDAPDGKPLSARLLGRAFLIRLNPTAADAPWQPKKRITPAPGRAPSVGALKKIFAPGDIPGEVENRLNALRAGLKKLGWTVDRHTLDQTWAYCAAATRMMTCSPLETLDFALSQRALPAMLAAMELEALHDLPGLLSGLPRCRALMEQPLPLPPL